jgi:hypothetical protein
MDRPAVSHGSALRPATGRRVRLGTAFTLYPRLVVVPTPCCEALFVVYARAYAYAHAKLHLDLAPHRTSAHINQRRNTRARFSASWPYCSSTQNSRGRSVSRTAGMNSQTATRPTHLHPATANCKVTSQRSSNPHQNPLATTVQSFRLLPGPASNTFLAGANIPTVCIAGPSHPETYYLRPARRCPLEDCEHPRTMNPLPITLVRPSEKV